MRDAKTLHHEVTSALDGKGHFDIDAIVADIDTDSIDDLDPADFWRIVGRHEQPEPDPRGDFQRDLSATIAGQRADRPALWTDGLVTVRARGVSRVNQNLPQPLAVFTIEAAGVDTVALGPGAGEIGPDWDMLWAAVVDVRDQAQVLRDQARADVQSATVASRKADQVAVDAKARRDDAVRRAMTAGLTGPDLADLTGLSAAMISKLTRSGVM